MELSQLQDSVAAQFFLTVAVALAGGLLAVRFKIPVGGMVGGMSAVALFNIVTGLAYAPDELKILTQSLAGAYLGMRIRKKDIAQFKTILLPATMMLVGLVIYNSSVGLLIASFTRMDLITALMSAVPGGVSEISLLSAEMGGNAAQVTIMHLLRIVSVLGVFPVMLRTMANRYGSSHEAADCGAEEEEDCPPKSLPMTVVLALFFGAIGYFSGLPAGTLAFSMVAVAVYNVKTDRAGIPPEHRKYVQMLAGLIIGKGVGMADVLQMPDILLPAALMITGFYATNLILSFIIAKYTKMDYTTALFSTSPAGPSDMALMALELGGDAPKVACMQIVRLLAAVVVFPQTIRLMVALFGN
jgi:membrane AbrB-like protein